MPSSRLFIAGFRNEGLFHRFYVARRFEVDARVTDPEASQRLNFAGRCSPRVETCRSRDELTRSRHLAPAFLSTWAHHSHSDVIGTFTTTFCARIWRGRDTWERAQAASAAVVMKTHHTPPGFPRKLLIRPEAWARDAGSNVRGKGGLRGAGTFQGRVWVRRKEATGRAPGQRKSSKAREPRGRDPLPGALLAWFRWFVGSFDVNQIFNESLGRGECVRTDGLAFSLGSPRSSAF